MPDEMRGLRDDVIQRAAMGSQNKRPCAQDPDESTPGEEAGPGADDAASARAQGIQGRARKVSNLTTSGGFRHGDWGG